MQAPLGPRRCGQSGRCAAAGAPGSAWPRLALASGRRDNALERLDAHTARRSRRVPAAVPLPPQSHGPLALPAGAGRERGPEALRHPGCGGVGTAASRLTCSGGGEAGLGGQLCPCALPLRGGPTAFCDPATVGFSVQAPRVCGAPTRDSFLRCRSSSVGEGRGLPTQPPGWAWIPEGETSRPWREDLGKGLHSPHSFVRLSSNGISSVRGATRRFCGAVKSPSG